MTVTLGCLVKSTASMPVVSKRKTQRLTGYCAAGTPAYHNISPYGAAAASSVQRLVTRTCPGLPSMSGSIFASTDMVNGPQSIIG